MKKSTENILFLIILISLFTAFDVYLSKSNPVSNSNLFYKNDYEKTILSNDNRKNYKDIFYGNSAVISAFDEEKSTSSYVNFGLDYAKISDLTEMLNKGYITVEDNIVIGLNYFTLMDTLDTNPTYPWHRKTFEPYLYFQRDRLYNFIENNINSLLSTVKLSDVRYDNLEKSVYYGKMTEDEITKKIETHKSLFWDLGMENYEENFKALQKLIDYCNKNNIRLRAVWMPWYKGVEIPKKPNEVKGIAIDILNKNNIEVLDLEHSFSDECFHDIGHLNWEVGAGIFTKEIDQWLRK